MGMISFRKRAATPVEKQKKTVKKKAKGK